MSHEGNNLSALGPRLDPTPMHPTATGDDRAPSDSIPQTSTGGVTKAWPWVIGLAFDPRVDGPPLRVSAGLEPDFPHDRAMNLCP